MIYKVRAKILMTNLKKTENDYSISISNTRDNPSNKLIPQLKQEPGYESRSAIWVKIPTKPDISNIQNIQNHTGNLALLV